MALDPLFQSLHDLAFTGNLELPGEAGLNQQTAPQAAKAPDKILSRPRDSSYTPDHSLHPC